jgi:hypothetical protein
VRVEVARALLALARLLPVLLALLLLAVGVAGADGPKGGLDADPA